MDNQNPQMQNPNVPPMTPAGGQPMGPTAPMMSQMSMKKKGPWLWIIIGIAAAVAGVAWWYISQMAVEPVGQQPSPVNQEAREDTMLSKDIQEADLGDLDKEFQAIDNDLNSL
ncbi:MAG: hypothetical protein Q8R55_07285 [Candidatus Taylorbacteria bacterium]|nr:hypothetical protein [Candidatus Taylorbacteria bacterium]